MNPIVKVDSLNTILMLLALLLAYFLPFDLFVISYAIIGPLHYLTEINWIRDNNYFVKSKYWIYIIVVFTTIVALPKIFGLDIFNNTESNVITFFQNELPKYTNALIFLALVIAYAFLFIKSKKYINIVIIIGTILALILNNVSVYNLYIGIFLPTIIHVFLFTLLFMFYGNLKTKSKIGYFNIILLAAIPLIISLISLDAIEYNFSDVVKNIIIDNRFHVLNVNLSKTLNLSDGKSFFFYEKVAIKIQIFIAFAYTYHYLNWFSKTTIIGWHKKITRKKSLLILVLWILSVSIYLYDYKVGLALLLILSLAHVFVELPINMITIKGIIKSIFNDSKLT